MGKDKTMAGVLLPAIVFMRLCGTLAPQQLPVILDKTKIRQPCAKRDWRLAILKELQVRQIIWRALIHKVI